MKKSIVCICVLVLCLLFQSCEYDFEPADGGTKSEKTTTTTVTTRGKNISPPSEGGNGEGDPYDFIITYSIKNSQYYPGDKFSVTITAKHNAGEDRPYYGKMDIIPTAGFSFSDESKKYFIPEIPGFISDDAPMDHVLSKDAVLTNTCEFEIPENALPGSYDLKVFIDDFEYSFVFSDAITVLE